MRAQPTNRNPRRHAVGFVYCVLCVAWVSFNLAAAEPAPTNLPPAATQPITFDRDVRPIFEASCFRCHGPLKPKSNFRLDNRASALKGGNDNSDDIIPGDSAKSRLIHYVARVAEEFQMPPEGKGEPLTGEQVGVLRAWIDQGAAWGAASEPELEFSISPRVRWLAVHGDEGKFRELEGIKPGWAGGIEQFTLKERLSPDEIFSAEGHAIFDEHDAALKLAFDKADVGFIHAGMEQWRRYYDDTGSYSRPLVPPSHDLGRDLHLDTGRAWIDFGLTRPDLPHLTFGYEFQFKDGAKSTLQWGAVQASFDPTLTNNIYPAAKEIEERVHILKLDLTHELGGWQLEDNARVEFYNLQSSRDNAKIYTTGPLPDRIERASENVNYIQGMNAVRAEKQLQEWWLFSAGYLYSKFDGDSSLEQTTLDPTSGYAQVGGDYRSANNVVLRRDSHVFSVANLLTPAPGLSAFASVQSEWTRQQGFGQDNYYHEPTNNAAFPVPAFQNSVLAQANLDEARTTENAGLRCTWIPRTVIFAEARLQQDAIGQFETGDPDPEQDFLRDTDARNNTRDWRAGFNTSPWRWLSWSADFRRRTSETDYNHLRDDLLTSMGVGTNNGYSAFISERSLNSDEIQTRLTLRLASWLKTSLTFEQVASDYFTTTAKADTKPPPGQSPTTDGASPGGSIFAGNYDAHIYGANVTLTPLRRFYFYGTFTYSDSRTTTAQNDFAAIVPYQGDTYTMIASASYVLNNSIDLHGSYAYSRARFGQHNEGDGLPLGLDYDRHTLTLSVTKKWNDSLSTTARYAYYRYEEPSSGGVNDYSAHGVFVTMNYKWR